MVRADPSRPPRGRPQTRRQQLVRPQTGRRQPSARRERPSASDRPQRRSEGGWSPAPGPRSAEMPFKGKVSLSGWFARCMEGRPPGLLFHLWAQPPSIGVKRLTKSRSMRSFQRHTQSPRQANGLQTASAGAAGADKSARRCASRLQRLAVEKSVQVWRQRRTGPHREDAGLWAWIGIGGTLACGGEHGVKGWLVDCTTGP